MEMFYKGRGEVKGLQLLKLLGAISIVHIHTHGFFGGAWNLVWRLAVPCFFMISGYFLLNNDGHFDLNRIRKALIKMIKLTFGASTIYIGLKWAIDITLDHYMPGRFSNILDPMASPVFWKRLLIFGDGAEGALWYLMAYTQLLGMLWLAVRFRFVKILIGVAIVAVPLMLWAEHHFIMGPSEIRIWVLRPYVVIRNVITMALPFVLAGALIRRYESIIRQHILPLVGFLILTIVALTVHEFRWMTDHGIFHKLDLYITTTPAAICLFILFLLTPDVGLLSPLAALGRNYATAIYLTHPMIINILPMAEALVKWLNLPVLDIRYRAWFTCLICIVLISLWIGTKKLWYNSKNKPKASLPCVETS